MICILINGGMFWNEESCQDSAREVGMPDVRDFGY